MSGVEGIAGAFVDARLRAASPIEYPGPVPQSLAEAYSIQDRAITLIDAPVIGWKVGRVPPPWDGKLGVNRLAGPIFRSVESGSDTAAMPVFANGFAAAEAEYLVRIGRSPAPGATGLSLEQAAELIDTIHIGIEIASSPYPGINTGGPLVTISDFGNNYGMLIDHEIKDWQALAFLEWPVETLVNDQVVGRATAREMLDGPIGAVAFLVDCLAARGLALTPGQWVSTGAVTGVHDVAVGDRVEAKFNGASVSCTIEAARS